MTWELQAKMDCKGHKDQQEYKGKRDSLAYMGFLGLEENLDLLAHQVHVDLLDHQGTSPWDEKCLISSCCDISKTTLLEAQQFMNMNEHFEVNVTAYILYMVHHLQTLCSIYIPQAINCA